MLNLTSSALKVFLALDPCDMRKSFNGLQQIAADQQQQTMPARDALFVFTNKRRNRIKLLYFDGTGTWVATKRLEKGRFSWPAPSEPGQRRIKLQTEALQLLIDGVDLRGANFKPWYERPESSQK
jgi:transposase